MDTAVCPKCNRKLAKDRGFPVFCSGGCRDTFYAETDPNLLVAWVKAREQMMQASKEEK